MDESELAKMKELLELAKITEQQAQELANFTLAIDHKYEKRLAKLKLDKKLKPSSIE
ncbi:hypothetical protein Cri9333_2074 [Crinalium epipsammum PCC 9333]|uniref:Uncharacterized protein n=2 Tax=Crinalium TaxID=241421 RepID=K9VYA1_9CYAN|nr:hypothetical protein Cri9333_2074 [Crinalium epipsammum PCC 9333]